MAKFYASMFATKNQTILSSALVNDMITPTGIVGDYAGEGFCQAWGLGFFLYYNPCLVNTVPSCSTACISNWKQEDRIAVYYEGQVKAFLFSVLHGENWTHPTGSHFISVATRNSIVVNTTQTMYNNAKLATVGTIDTLTKGWPQYGISIMNCMQNWIIAYKGGYKSLIVGGYSSLSNAATAPPASSCSTSDNSLSAGEVVAAVVVPTLVVCILIICYLHFIFMPNMKHIGSHKESEMSNPVRATTA